MIRILKYTLGVVFVIIGLLALVTPFTPGSWLAIIGAELLGLGFLLPKKVREPWEKAKQNVRERFSRWYREKFSRRPEEQ